MHKLLSLLIASVSVALTLGASAQTATPATSNAQPIAQQAPANSDKAPSAEPSKAHKKGKKKKLKKKKARR
jgi:Ni/Co efflux regulator RcnB